MCDIIFDDILGIVRYCMNNSVIFAIFLDVKLSNLSIIWELEGLPEIYFNSSAYNYLIFLEKSSYNC